jgi:PHD/YefM family antitoxin component YafN of YafNO toxin-antitoxin module
MKMQKLHIRPERELRNNFSEIAKLNDNNDVVMLTNRGRASRFLLNADEFDEYEEFRHNRYLMEKIKEAEADPDTKLRTHDEVWQIMRERYVV